MMLSFYSSFRSTILKGTTPLTDILSVGKHQVRIRSSGLSFLTPVNILIKNCPWKKYQTIF